MEQGQARRAETRFKPKDIWALRVRLQTDGRVRELALFNLGIDSKLRGCDLVDLAADLPGRDLAWVPYQLGMFSYTGLALAQVKRLRDEHAVHLIRSGRICTAGVNSRNVDRTADAMAAVLQQG